MPGKESRSCTRNLPLRPESQPPYAPRAPNGACDGGRVLEALIPKSTTIKWNGCEGRPTRRPQYKHEATRGTRNHGRGIDVAATIQTCSHHALTVIPATAIQTCDRRTRRSLAQPLGGGRISTTHSPRARRARGASGVGP